LESGKIGVTWNAGVSCRFNIFMPEKNSLRIASLLPSTTEILCALGLEENIVGITHECDFPESIQNKPHLTSSRISHETMSSAEIDHAVRSQLDGHGSIYDLNAKLLAELKPDLILTQELCEVCAVSYKTVQKAAKMFVADAKVVSLEPNTIGDIFENIKTVGELCGAREKAEKVVANLENRLTKVREKSENLKKRPRVFMLEWLEPPFAPGHWTPEQVEIAGGHCLLGKAGEKSQTTTFEKIFGEQPEILVLIPCGYYTKDIVRQLVQTKFPSNWRELAAVKNDNVWAMDASAFFSRPAPRVIDGTEILAKIFHPDIFGEPSEAEAVRVKINFL
jgi:iron complex transport system substrate-binding protein